MKNSQFVSLKPNDPLRAIMDDLKKLTVVAISNTNIEGIRHSLTNLPR